MIIVDLDSYTSETTPRFFKRILELSITFRTNEFAFCFSDGKHATELINYLTMSGFANIYKIPGATSYQLISKLVSNWIGQFVIVSNNRDLCSNLACNVHLYDPEDRRYYTMILFKNEFGVERSVLKQEFKDIPIPTHRIDKFNFANFELLCRTSVEMEVMYDSARGLWSEFFKRKVW